jgi:hypothetical protein
MLSVNSFGSTDRSMFSQTRPKAARASNAAGFPTVSH